MSRFRSRRARREENAELNVTAFMNLMVVLVPFLLILAVFSRVTVHELSLPGEATREEETPPLQLEVVLRADRIVLNDRNQGTLQEIANVEGEYDIATLSQWLQELKQDVPGVDRATILLEPQVSYQSLIAVMDTMRGAEREQDGERVRVELFPHVSIGDAPAEGGSA